jgi:hypothetical protein
VTETITPIDMTPVAMEQMLRTVGRSRDEVVGYYRLPDGYRDGAASRWITFADTQPGKRLPYMERGWTPLPQYGRVWGKDPDGNSSKEYVWLPILSTAQGRAEFPASQVLTYGWYRPERLPAPLRGRALDFPQLEKAIADGLEVHEYECPECTGQRFFTPWALASHLRNHHDYDRAEIIALGKEVGVDFAKTLKRLINPMRSVTLEDVTVAAAPAASPVAVATAVIPTIRPRSTRGAELDPEDDLVARMAAELAALRAEMAALKTAPAAAGPKPRKRRTMSEEARVAARAALQLANAALAAKRAEAATAAADPAF